MDDIVKLLREDYGWRKIESKAYGTEYVNFVRHKNDLIKIDRRGHVEIKVSSRLHYHEVFAISMYAQQRAFECEAEDEMEREMDKGLIFDRY